MKYRVQHIKSGMFIEFFVMDIDWEYLLVPREKSDHWTERWRAEGVAKEVGGRVIEEEE